MGGTVRTTRSETDGLRVRTILFLMVRFAVLAPVCLFLWWTIMPWYADIMGRVAATAFLWILRIPIEGYRVETGGLMNTHTVLLFRLEDGSMPGIAIGHLFSNIAPYIALVLATTGITVKRRVGILIAGVAILFVGHILFLVTMFSFMEHIEGASQVPTAMGQLLITLPFLLWVILAYWEKLMGLLGSGLETAQQEPRGKPDSSS